MKDAFSPQILELFGMRMRLECDGYCSRYYALCRVQVQPSSAESSERMNDFDLFRQHEGER